MTLNDNNTNTFTGSNVWKLWSTFKIVIYHN